MGRDWMSDFAESNDRPLRPVDFANMHKTAELRTPGTAVQANTDHIRKKNVEIYRRRYEQGVDLWTGDKLAPEE